MAWNSTSVDLLAFSLVNRIIKCIYSANWPTHIATVVGPSVHEDVRDDGARTQRIGVQFTLAKVAW